VLDLPYYVPHWNTTVDGTHSIDDDFPRDLHYRNVDSVLLVGSVVLHTLSLLFLMLALHWQWQYRTGGILHTNFYLINLCLLLLFSIPFYSYQIYVYFHSILFLSNLCLLLLLFSIPFYSYQIYVYYYYFPFHFILVVYLCFFSDLKSNIYVCSSAVE
jgi:hypothetical protein